MLSGSSPSVPKCGPISGRMSDSISVATALNVLSSADATAADAMRCAPASPGSSAPAPSPVIALMKFSTIDRAAPAPPPRWSRAANSDSLTSAPKIPCTTGAVNAAMKGKNGSSIARIVEPAFVASSSAALWMTDTHTDLASAWALTTDLWTPSSGSCVSSAVNTWVAILPQSGGSAVTCGSAISATLPGYGGTMDLLPPGLALFAIFLWVALVFGLVAAPFAIIDMARSLRGIHRELRRVNGGAAVAQPEPAPLASPAAERAAPQDLGHQLLR
jgi:hypothetical protein